MKVVLLCGGDSLRFKNLLIPSSKVMAPIGGQPLITHIMHHYASFGFKDFILCVKNSDKEITQYFDQDKQFNQVQVVKTGDNTPTGGRLKKIEHLVKDELFMLTYGDGLSDVDLHSLLSFHKNHGNLASLTAVQPMEQYGILNIDNEQNIIQFVEKPRMKDWINGGFFIFNRAIFDMLNINDELETQLLQNLANTRELKAFYHHGFWKSMDTYKDYEDLNEMFSSIKK